MMILSILIEYIVSDTVSSENKRTGTTAKAQHIPSWLHSDWAKWNLLDSTVIPSLVQVVNVKLKWSKSERETNSIPARQSTHPQTVLGAKFWNSDYFYERETKIQKFGDTSNQKDSSSRLQSSFGTSAECPTSVFCRTSKTAVKLMSGLHILICFSFLNKILGFMWCCARENFTN